MLHSFILAESQDYLVFNKPAGLAIHSQSGPGLIAQLRSELGNDNLFPVHRLDTVTSGLLLLAKSSESNQALSLLFQEKKVEKMYLALMDAKPRKTQGRIEGDMIKARGGSWRLAKTRRNPALTCFFSFGYAPGKRFALLKPYTGKTHQLRVALKALGSPILGDERYGGSPHTRTCLHAWQLRFEWQGSMVQYCAPFSETPDQADYKRALCEFDNEQLAAQIESLGPPFELAWPKIKLARTVGAN